MKVRSPTLLVALVVLLLAYPWLEKIASRWLLSSLTIVVLASAAYTIGTTRRHLVGAAALGIPAATAQVLVVGEASGPRMLVDALQLIFVVYVIGVLFGFVLRQGAVGVEKLSAAAALYLLLGLTWAFLYRLTNHFQGASFTLSSGTAAPTFSDLLYFSYVTLTTLGYGDITPANDFSRSLAMLEAMSGTFFSTVLVARLVALYGSPAIPGGDESSGSSGA
ncbi:MAG: potassium channel family protein [Myxococcota bacterium]